MATIDVDGRRVPYRLDGAPDGPLLVLANSLGLTMDMWLPQLPDLTNHFRVLRYEHRGHGGADAPAGPYAMADLGSDLLALLDALDEPCASIVGLSVGGMVAMWVAAHVPERVERLALCCTAPVLGPRDAWIDRAADVRAQGTAFLVDVLVPRWFTEGAVAARPELRSVVGTMLAAVDPEGYAGCCEAIASMDQRADLGRITAPTLVLAGAADPVTPPDAALELHQEVAGSSLVVVPDASHLANLEQSETVTAALLAHLTGLPATAGRRVRRQVLGDAHVDAAEARRTPFTAPFQDLITRYAWGEIWTRPGLDRRTRSCITLAMLVALGRFDELPLHVRGALRNGLSTDEIGEVLLQTAVYCGVPAANSAFATAQRALDELAGDERPD